MYTYQSLTNSSGIRSFDLALHGRLACQQYKLMTHHFMDKGFTPLDSLLDLASDSRTS